ncbi:VOC family protein [Allosphingosinicella deserti]|uniref:Bleomycin resistance protein n=1 Tax=Allosphingosinicella deserti TaxID=2116704 RepID=A0A2P7QNA3_9SPHN|nr:VOC family protein [Sphingomonas deserti]PSJ39447.1 bleomycin resistance protein [Sphingomonas deserti]
MAVTLNHILVHAHDAKQTARFLTETLGLDAQRQLGHFTIVQVGETSLDLIETEEPITPRHFAFLVSEPEFDEILSRIRSCEIPFWADPFHRDPQSINHWDDGRGVYFDDPNGHVLEVITRPYGSGGLDAEHPNPLLRR